MRLPLVPEPNLSSASLPAWIEGHAHVIISAEQDRVLALDHRLGGRLHLLHHDREGIGDAAVEQRLALGDQAVELRHQIAFWRDFGRAGGERVGGVQAVGHVSVSP